MPRRAHYAAGTPCWIDRITADLSATQAFYGDLFGWTFADDAAGYRTALQSGEIVAGFGSANGPREFWTIYLASSDLEATQAVVVAAGGTVVLAPMDAGGNGRLFLAIDPGGTLVGFWRGTHDEGVVLVDEPGAACRYELRVTRADAIADFYGAVFGFDLVDDGQGLRFVLDGRTIVDIVEDADIAPHWQVYFGVADRLTAVREALAGGARLSGQNADGSVAMIDPRGAHFGLQQIS